MHIHVHIYETVYVYVLCFLLVSFFCRINTSMLRYLSALYFLKVDTHCNKLDMMGGEDKLQLMTPSLTLSLTSLVHLAQDDHL